MKKLQILAKAWLLSLGISATAFAQGTPSDGCDASCLNGTLNISTGYVQSSGTYNTPLANESNWTLVSIPPGATPTSAAYDISPHPAWSSFPQATWVSAYQFAGYTPNNCMPSAPFVFQKCFCNCRDAQVTIDFEMLVDDGAFIYLDGTLIASATAGWQFQWNNRLIFNQSFNLPAGQHCLTVELHNCGGVAMGFALEGTITGFDLLRPECCVPTGSICGTKIFDDNCDGKIDPTIDPGLAGWTINLYDNLGNLIATTVTDASGSYCFTGLAPGTYIVKEVNQPGWTQTYPASGSHTITIHAGDVGTAIFGNCRNTPPPCNVYADFNILGIKDCQLSLQALYPVIPPGSQLISTHWTFGDGESSNDPNPVHYYANPGTYTVCLTVTIFNGEECCSKTYCQDITIDKACNNGCDFDAYVNTVFDGSSCTYTFSSVINWAGMPVTSIFWDFGDGTYGSGSTVDHQFPGPGSYVVCMYLFANSPDGTCCVRKYCVDVIVRCSPCGEGGTGTGSNPKNMPAGKNDPVNVLLNDNHMVVLKQNVPNPFAESTVITYNIPTDFVKAQMVFTNLDGKIIKTVDISRKGEGQLNVYSDDLSSGTYIYTLVVDGKTIDSKRMIKK